MEATEKKHHALEAAIDLIGGMAGGTASVYVGQPLDTVKVKMQTFPSVHKSGLTCFLQTYRQDGLWKGLYAGTIPSLAAQISENAVLFMAYGLCQKGVAMVSGRKNVSDLTPLQNACAGSAGGFFCSLTLCPTELIKCKQQAMREKINSGMVKGITMKEITPLSITKQVLREQGIRGIFTGLVPTFAREMPGYFFFFGGYELSKRVLSGGKSDAELSAVKTMLCGGFGGTAFWLAIFPADVIKSRVQVNVTGATKMSFIATARNIYKTEGIMSMYRGLGPTLLRTFPATGALFVAYEYTKLYLTKLLIGNST